MTARCANCGLPSHRYGTGDRNHDPDKTACINLLNAQIGLAGRDVRGLQALKNHPYREEYRMERPRDLHTLEVALTALEQHTPRELKDHLEDLRECRRRLQALEIHTKYARRRRPDPKNEGHIVEEYVPR